MLKKKEPTKKEEALETEQEVEKVKINSCARDGNAKGQVERDMQA